MKPKSNLKEDLKSPWLLGIIGTVAIALIANGIMITLSFMHPHSLVAKDYYQKGKAYFHDQAKENSGGKTLGFKLQLTTPEVIHANSNEKIGLKVVDRNGKLFTGKPGTLYVYRADDMKQDFKTILSPSPNGILEAEVNFSLPGNWDLIGQIIINGEKLDVAQRIFVRK
jgi:hypothetical protein